VEAVVLAAEGLSVASGTRADTDDGDGGAGEADDGVHVLDDDTEEGELLSDSGRVGRAGGVAALDGAGVALGSRGSIVGEGTMGNGKRRLVNASCDSEEGVNIHGEDGGNDEELGEHCDGRGVG
jgi:hypothetical protein